jgi:cytochrome oxidase assembly protein ShyY1
VYRFVFSWRWIRLHVLVWLILIPAFIGLGMWQQSRYHERSREIAVLKAALHGAPVPIATVDVPGATVSKDARWRQVLLTGVYDTGHQYLARNHMSNGNPGFYVVTPLVAADGTAVLVNRGWIPADGSDPQITPPIPAAPTGTVTVTGRMEMSETKSNTGIRDVTAGLPKGQISLINTEALATTTGLNLRGGYVEQISSIPADSADVTLLDEPSLDMGPYLGYWFQWWLFAVIAVGAWVVIIRREAQHRVAEAAEGDDDAEDVEDYEAADDSEGDPSGGPSVDAAADGEPNGRAADQESQDKLTEPAL